MRVQICPNTSVTHYSQYFVSLMFDYVDQIELVF